MTQEIDAIGLLCPLPVLRARKALAPLPPGAELRILADDGMAELDMPHFCQEAGHILISATPTGLPPLRPGGRVMAYVIRKGTA